MNQQLQALEKLHQQQIALAEEYFNVGLNLAQQGKLADSEIAFRQAINLKPDYAEAYGNLGVILKSQGKASLTEIANIFRKSIQLQPNNPDICYNLGTVLTQDGSSSEAIEWLNQAIKLKPNYPQAYFNLGLAYKEQGLVSLGIDCLNQGINLNPNYLQAYFNLAIIYKEQNQLDKALKAFSQVIKLKPDYAEAYNYIGAILTEQSNPNLDNVANYFKQAIKLNPDYSEAYYNLGVVYTELGLLNEAEKAFKIAIKQNPNYHQAYNNLGALLKDKNQLNQAARNCLYAIKIKPDYYQSYYNLSLIFKEKLLLDKAEKTIRQGLKINPDYPKGHFILAYILLLQGNFKEGFEKYESRWQSHQLTLPKVTQPLWTGSDLKDKTIMLFSEQGFGDTLQFIRYASVLNNQGATVKLACQEPLIDLLKNIDCLTEVVSRQKPITTDFDVYCPLMSLPLFCQTTLDTVPAPIPYIKCHRSIPLIASPDTRLKIGIVWASGLRSTKSETYYAYQKKSCNLKLFIQLLSIPGITLYSLQVGKDAQQIDEYYDEPRLVNLSPTIKNFTDTAAIINELDLVISVDTSVAHLAGAMGKPVWLLLPFSPEWRWLVGRNDSPWYPTMRLFRQPQPEDWGTVFEEVLTQLKQLLKLESK